MKKKLLITVGAGASIDFGLPSVWHVDQLLDKCALKTHPLADDPSISLYAYFRDAIQGYYAQNPKKGMAKTANFEEILYQLNLLIPYYTDRNWLHGSKALLKPQHYPEIMYFGSTRRTIDGDVLSSLTAELMDALVEHFIDKCEDVSRTKQRELVGLHQFLNVLQNEYDIGIITLNYDNVFEQALPNLHTGFDDLGFFEPTSVYGRTDWGFIYHLHGSVNFAMTGVDADLHGITWTKTPTKSHEVQSGGRSRHQSMEGTQYPSSTFIAGYGKPQQLMRQPFSTYFSQAGRVIEEADSILFIGYGFSDQHLNGLFSGVRSKRRPVVVLDWAKDDQDPLQFRQDNWTYNLFETLKCAARVMAAPGRSSAPDVGELKATNEFEVSSDTDRPLAVWYNGLAGACTHPDKILANLK